MSDVPQTPQPPPGSEADPPEEESQWEPWVGIAREFAISILVVVLIAAILFGISGVWPPLVAVESDSMEPQIMTGDLVFIVQEERFADEHAISETGIVTAAVGEQHGHEAFDRPGDVIIFAPNGDGSTTPIIHRAHFYVEEGEDWSDRANPRLIGGADDCDDLSNCPAPNEGFITHGDNNAFYDQVQEHHRPVKPEWVAARASMRVPWVGHIRLILADLVAFVLPVGVIATRRIGTGS